PPRASASARKPSRRLTEEPRQFLEGRFRPWAGPGNACIRVQAPGAVLALQQQPVERRPLIEVNAPLAAGGEAADGLEPELRVRCANREHRRLVWPEPPFVKVLDLPDRLPPAPASPQFDLGGEGFDRLHPFVPRLLVDAIHLRLLRRIITEPP